jgi:hypothetical protein
MKGVRSLLRRKLGILLFICILSLIIVSPATAITNHNLHWGFEDGDQFHYSISGNQFTDISDYYVEVDSIPTLPEDINFFSDIPYYQIGVSFYYENGTEFEQYYLSMYWMAFPIGNWSFIQELIGDNPYSENTIIDTASEWGVSNTQEYGGTTQSGTIKFSKADGVLNLYSIVIEPEVGETQSMTITRKGVWDGIISLPALLIGGGSALIIVVVVILIYMDQRE